jgi:hypothetical protein
MQGGIWGSEDGSGGRKLDANRGSEWGLIYFWERALDPSPVRNRSYAMGACTIITAVR